MNFISRLLKKSRLSFIVIIALLGSYQACFAAVGDTTVVGPNFAFGKISTASGKASAGRVSDTAKFTGTAPVQVTSSGKTVNIAVPPATTSSNGLMSAADKQALNGVDVFPVSYYNDNLKFHGVVLDKTPSSWDSNITQTGPIIKAGSTSYMVYGGWDGVTYPPDVSGGVITAVNSNTITIVANKFTNDYKMHFTGTPPAPLTAGTDYYIVNATTDTFQVSATSGGAPITLTNAATGATGMIERGRAFRLGVAISADGVTWVKNAGAFPGFSGLVGGWIPGIYKMTPDEMKQYGSRIYLFVQIQKTQMDNDHAYEEDYYYTDNLPDGTMTWTPTWTFGGKVFNKDDLGMTNQLTNISITPKQADGYYYATMDDWWNNNVGQFRTRMLRTNADPPISGWSITWGGKDHIVLDPSDPQRAGTDCDYNIMGSRIWQDPVSAKWIILTTCDNAAPSIFDWSTLHLHYSNAIDGPYTTLRKPFYAGSGFMEGRHYVVAGALDASLTIYTDSDFDGISPSVGKFDTNHNIDVASVLPPVANHLAMWNNAGDIIDAGNLVGIGTTTPIAKLHVHTSTAPSGTNLYEGTQDLTLSSQDTIAAFNIVTADGTGTAGNRGFIRGIRSRGSLVSPTVPSMNDGVFNIIGGIWDGGAVINTADISFSVDGTVSSGAAPQRISFRTKTGGSGAYAERLTILNGGKVGINNTSPSEQLDVVGNVKATSFIGDGSQLTGMSSDASSLRGTPVDGLTATTNWILGIGSNGHVGTAPISSWLGYTPVNTTTTVNGHALSSNVTVTGADVGIPVSTAGYIPFYGSTTALSSDAGFSWDNTNKRLGVGTTSPLAQIETYATTASTGGIQLRNEVTSATGAPFLIFRHTNGSDTYAAAGDELGVIQWGSRSGGANRNGVKIVAYAGSTFSSTNAEAYLSFLTNAGNVTNTLTERLRIKSSGAINFVPLASAPASPAEGDFYGDSTSHTPQYHNGTAFKTIAYTDSNITGTAAKWTTARNLAGNSVDGSANVSFSNKFIVQGTSDAGLSGPQFLGALGTGIVKNTTSTGVLSIATGADLPVMTATVGGAVPTPPNNTTTFLRGDGTFAAPAAGTFAVTQTQIDFGWPAVPAKAFVITDAGVASTAKITCSMAYVDIASDNTADALMSGVQCAAGKAVAGSFTVMVSSQWPLGGKFKVNYSFAN